ncbi:MAG: serine protease [Deltaproteobacteria bacterium]|nr:serine protease [Deltaproteobacteria bacterium]
MRAHTCFALLLGLAAACGSPDDGVIGEVTAPVVYGEEDRVEVYNHPDAELRSIAEQSIVALIPSFRISREPNGTYSLFTISLKDARDLCEGELFGDQPTAASCSGVLIDDDLVLTAGHCIDERTPCDSYSFVFNYRYAQPNVLAAIRDDDVYSCQRVVSQASAAPGAWAPDFAVIQLDRPVQGDHAPAVIRPASALAEQEPLSMIGFGSGLPAKIDDGGSVADPRAAELDFFVANLDAFQGHSGSATFDSQNRLAGILIGGRAPDYVTFENVDCARVSVYEDSQAGELVHNIAPIVAALCEDGWQAQDLCDPDACGGQPCGSAPLPSGGGTGAFPPQSSSCTASKGSTRSWSGWMGLLLFVVARRFRQRVA